MKMSILKVYLYTKQYYEVSMRYITSNVAICVYIIIEFHLLTIQNPVLLLIQIIF